MEREFRITADGSHTLFVKGLNEPYHSVNGAITESMQVFIRNGLKAAGKKKIRVLEFGFGTGLNALLTLLEAARSGLEVGYHTLEKYPVTLEEADRLNYPDLLGEGSGEMLSALHRAPWDTVVEINPSFILEKIRGDFTEIEHFPRADLVYYDAFAPDIQPGLWTEELFFRIAGAMEEGGILVTYSAKGSVRRALQAAGLRVEKLPGPPGKREVLRAVKLQ